MLEILLSLVLWHWLALQTGVEIKSCNSPFWIGHKRRLKRLWDFNNSFFGYHEFRCVICRRVHWNTYGEPHSVTVTNATQSSVVITTTQIPPESSSEIPQSNPSISANATSTASSLSYTPDSGGFLTQSSVVVTTTQIPPETSSEIPRSNPSISPNATSTASSPSYMPGSGGFSVNRTTNAPPTGGGGGGGSGGGGSSTGAGPTTSPPTTTPPPTTGQSC